MGMASFGLMTVFQNCGQAGSITPASDTIEDSFSPDPGTPVTPPAGQVPKDYEKTVTVNQSNGQVDVLIVMDNSGSMRFEQGSMRDRFSNFLSRLQGLDWQVGITTTDARASNTPVAGRDGHLLTYQRLNKSLLSSNDNPQTASLAFSETIQQTGGSGQEQGVRATYRALENAVIHTMAGSGLNRGLVRPGAALSVILVSDADETVDSSRPGDLATFTDRNRPEKLREYIQSAFPGKVFKFNSIVVRNDDQACLSFPNSQNEGYGRNYQTLSNLTSGIIGSVCEADYSNQLTVIGDNTVEMVRTITLDCSPLDLNQDGKADITVTMMGNNSPLTNYTVTGRVITFSANLAVGSYKVAYKCLAN